MQLLLVHAVATAVPDVVVLHLYGKGAGPYCNSSAQYQDKHALTHSSKQQPQQHRSMAGIYSTLA